MERHQFFNELTDYDIWFLKMAVMISYNKSYQCGECVKISDEKYRHIKMGCLKLKSPKEDEGFIVTKCPGNFWNAGYSKVVDLYFKYRQGVLSELGGIFDQSSKYISAMSFVGALVTKEEARIFEASKPKTGKSNGRK